jgi:hypothetical protein
MSNTRNIHEFLNSGDAENIVIGDNLVMQKADNPDAIGLVMTIGLNGQVVGRVITDAVNDIEWLTNNHEDVVVNDGEELLADVTIDQDISAQEGSFQFYAKIDNESRRDTDVILKFNVNGVTVAEKPFTISGSLLGYPAAFWGKFTADRQANDRFTVTAVASNQIRVTGSLVPISLKIIKTPATALTVDNIAEADFSKLPTSDPHIKGRLWVNHRGSLKVSDG